MVDSTFYESLGPFRLADIAERVGGRLARPDDAAIEIRGVGALAADAPGDSSDDASGLIGFYDDPKQRRTLRASRLSACLARERDVADMADALPALVVVERPKAAFAQVCDLLARPWADDFGEAGVHPSARIAPDARIASGARIAQNVEVGARARVGANAVIGCGVTIGEGADIAPGVVLRFAHVGAHTTIRANAAIGEAGFGLTPSDAGLVELPHLGRVLIGENVLIGAGTTVDRGRLADTEIGDGTKIDNLVQVAHNVRIGRSCILAGCCGISGSVTIEDGAVLGGSVGVSDHVRIGAGATLVGATLVMRDVPPRERWAGAPARPARRFFREILALERLAQGRDKGGDKSGGDTS